MDQHPHLATYLSVASTINGIDVVLFVVAVMSIAGWITSSLELRARQERVDGVFDTIYDLFVIDDEPELETQLYDWQKDGL